jgi:hypothetical protein
MVHPLLGIGKIKGQPIRENNALYLATEEENLRRKNKVIMAMS